MVFRGRRNSCRDNKKNHRKMLAGRAMWVVNYYTSLVVKTGLPLDEALKLKTAYLSQKHHAKSGRKIVFNLTFDEWLKLWIDSGHLRERGRKKGQYVMARFGDKGPYEVGNVNIIKHEQNVKEAFVGKPLSEAHKRKIGDANRDRLS